MSESVTQPSLDIIQVMQYLPHRYPFLMVDRVLEFVPRESILALKNVTVNEPHFQGHFPGKPVMPGVLILEALAQTGGVLVANSIDEPMEDKLFMFSSMEKVRFRRQVVPGDQLHLECTEYRQKMRMVRMAGKAFVGGELAAEGVLTAAVIDRESI